MGISFADIREADRLDRSYAEARRRHNGGGSPAFDALLFVAKWGLPFLPLLPLVWGGEVLRGRWFGLALVAVWICAKAIASSDARRSEFEVLRFRDPGALFLARLARSVRLFAFVGAWLALWRYAMLDTPPGLAVTAAMLCATVGGAAFSVVALAHRHGARGPAPQPGVASQLVVTGLLLLIVAALIATDLAAGAWSILALADLVNRRTEQHAPAWWESLLDGVVVLCCVTVLQIDPASRPEILVGLAAAALVIATVRGRQMLSDGVIRARFVAGGEADAMSGADAAGPSLTSVVRRSHPGVGITRALTRKWWIGVRGMFTPSATVLGPRRVAAFALIALVAAPVALAWHLRGAILAAIAVGIGAANMPEAAVFAVASAAFSPSILEADLDERRHLFGVDYTEQVRHAMRTWFVVGCLPCVVAAAVVLVATGAPSGALAAACFLGACLLLRFGWNGLRGESAFASGCLATIALGGALLWFEPTADILLPLAAGIGGLGLLGTVARFRNLDEPALRAQMRLKD